MSWLPPGPSRRFRWWRRLVLAGCLPLILGAAGWRGLQWVLPYGSPPRTAPGTLIIDRHGVPILELAADDGQWRLPTGPIDPRLAAAVVAVEDQHFHRHHGVDWLAGLRAAGQNLGSGTVVSGASTLTMQVERLRHRRPRTLGNKLVEAFRAGQIEDRLDKEAILDEWAARAPFGRNAVGAEAAARRWFGKTLTACSDAEIALLAGLPQGPVALRPDRRPQAARARRDRVLRDWHRRGGLDDAALARALAEPVTAVWQPAAQNTAPTGALPSLLTLAEAHRGQVVSSTIDHGIQTTADTLARSHRQRFGLDGLGVLVVAVEDASVRAAVSLGEEGLVDLTDRRRSSGSTLKPFLYALACERGLLDMHSLVADRPGAWQGWDPANHDHQHLGWMTAADALATSRNLPAIDLVERLGLQRVHGQFAALGLTVPADAGLGLAIGGTEVSMRELAAAWLTLVDGGRFRPLAWTATTRPDARPVLDSRASARVLAALAEGRRTAAIDGRAAELGAAWKTGTAADHRDAWCVAATPRWLVVVWCGRSDGRGDGRLTGIAAAAPLALGLVAAIDPGGAGFGDPGPDPSAPERLVPRPRPLVIASPVDQAVLHRVAGANRAPLRAAGGQPPYHWFIDGSPIGSSTGHLMWEPAAGRHHLRVVDGAGSARAISVTVR